MQNLITQNNYLTFLLISALSGLLLTFTRAGFKKLEEIISLHLSTPDASKVNSFLEVLDRMTESVVQDANSRVVIGLKSQGLFTPEVAAAVKKTAVQDVIKNLGDLHQFGLDALGPLENIVGQFVEKHVLGYKSQVTKLTAHK